MADMTNIVDFNNSDGLPPGVVQKLNNNFWHTISKILTPQIVVSAGSTKPDPRTDETLFYDTITGDLYIWREFQGNWGWDKIDIGYIHVDLYNPYDSRTTYTRKNEFLWIATSDDHFMPPIYVWARDPSNNLIYWVPLQDFVEWVAKNLVMYKMTTTDWLDSQYFCDAVLAIIDDPDSYR